MDDGNEGVEQLVEERRVDLAVKDKDGVRDVDLGGGELMQRALRVEHSQQEFVDQLEDVEFERGVFSLELREHSGKQERGFCAENRLSIALVDGDVEGQQTPNQKEQHKVEEVLEVELRVLKKRLEEFEEHRFFLESIDDRTFLVRLRRVP